MLNALDLFSGIGGISLALQGYARTVAYCENNRFCHSILLSRMSSGHLDTAPIWDDIRTLSGNHFGSQIDLITGGFPCQDISSHGSQRGLEGRRSGLFYEIVRLAVEIRPRFLFLENVSNITKKGLREVTGEITRLRYDCRWLIIPASAVGAPHPRKRWFMLAHSNLHRHDGGGGVGEVGQVLCHGQGDDPARDSHRADHELESRALRADSPGRREPAAAGDGSEATSAGEAEPCMVRMAHGLPRGVDGHRGWDSERGLPRIAEGIPDQRRRVQALGNSVCPAQVRQAFELLLFGN